MNNTLIDFTELEKNLGVVFKDKSILFQALTHRSFLNETKISGLQSNERLEFLGDSVLSFCISSEIFNRFPNFPEGQLTFIRTHLVRTETLTELSKKLKLGKYLQMSRGEELSGGKENLVLLANCFEAVLGAIYLDLGIQKASEFVKKQFSQLIDEITDVENLKDNKSLLQEKVQSHGYSSPSYRLISSSGPDHQRSFTMGVFLGSKFLSEGTSRSKQEAEEEAAKKALEILGKIK